MILKTFDKVNSEVATEYTVWGQGKIAERQLLDSFVVNYLELDFKKFSRNHDRLKKYEKAKVENVSVNMATGMLRVTLVAQ